MQTDDLASDYAPVSHKMKPTVLFTGGSSLLAVNWASLMRDQYTVYLGLHQRDVLLNGVKTQRVSFASIEEAQRALGFFQPDLVVHTIGLTSVEQCESNPGLARHVNVDMAEHVASACAHAHVAMVHISTDHLFSGQRSFTGEDDPVEPQNEYGRSKAEAEKRVLAACPDALVVRTNFFGWGTSYRHSFSDKIITSLRDAKPMKLFTDVFYTPILIESLVLAVHELLAKKETGIFNVVGDDRVSKHQFGLKLSDQFQLDKSLIQPSILKECPNLIKRPLDMSLSNKKICNVLGHRLGSIENQIDCLIQQESTVAASEVMKL